MKQILIVDDDIHIGNMLQEVKSAVFVLPSPLTPMPISKRFGSSFESNRKTCLFSRNARFLHFVIIILKQFSLQKWIKK